MVPNRQKGPTGRTTHNITFSIVHLASLGKNGCSPAEYIETASFLMIEFAFKYGI